MQRAFLPVGCLPIPDAFNKHSLRPSPESDHICWQGGFTWHMCCDPTLGPGGNVDCWNGIFTFESCCVGPSQSDATMSSPTNTGAKPSDGERGQERPLGVCVVGAVRSMLEPDVMENAERYHENSPGTTRRPHPFAEPG